MNILTIEGICSYREVGYRSDNPKPGDPKLELISIIIDGVTTNVLNAAYKDREAELREQKGGLKSYKKTNPVGTLTAPSVENLIGSMPGFDVQKYKNHLRLQQGVSVSRDNFGDYTVRTPNPIEYLGADKSVLTFDDILPGDLLLIQAYVRMYSYDRPSLGIGKNVIPLRVVRLQQAFYDSKYRHGGAKPYTQSDLEAADKELEDALASRMAAVKKDAVETASELDTL